MESTQLMVPSLSHVTPTYFPLSLTNARKTQEELDEIVALVRQAQFKASMPGNLPAVYDNSMLTEFMRCPRKFFLSHILHLQGREFEKPLIFGSAIHAGLEVYYRETVRLRAKLKESGKTWSTLGAVERELCENHIRTAALVAYEKEIRKDPRMPELKSNEPPRIKPYSIERGSEILYQYFVDRPYDNDLWVVESEDDVEIGFAIVLGGFIFVGKLDLLVRLKSDRSLCIVDHKTTTRMTEFYGSMWNPADQFTGYMASVSAIRGEKIRKAIVNALHFNKNICNVSSIFPTERSDMNIAEWEIEVVGKMQSVEKMYFDWVNHPDVSSIDVREKLIEATGELEEEKYIKVNTRLDTTAITAFPKTTANCFNYFRPCKFLPICKEGNLKMREVVRKSGYIESQWLPFDALSERNEGVEAGEEA